MKILGAAPAFGGMAGGGLWDLGGCDGFGWVCSGFMGGVMGLCMFDGFVDVCEGFVCVCDGSEGLCEESVGAQWLCAHLWWI